MSFTSKNMNDEMRHVDEPSRKGSLENKTSLESVTFIELFSVYQVQPKPKYQ